MSNDYLKELFIDEAKPAMSRHSGGGGGKLYAHRFYSTTYTETDTVTITAGFYSSHEKFESKAELVEYLTEKGFTSNAYGYFKLPCNGTIHAMMNPVGGFLLSSLYVMDGKLYVEIINTNGNTEPYEVKNISTFIALEV